MMWNTFGQWGGGFGFGWIFMLLFWGLVIWAFLSFIRSASDGSCCGKGHGNQLSGGGKSALDILKERYAKGEITKEDFDRMRKDLE